MTRPRLHHFEGISMRLARFAAVVAVVPLLSSLAMAADSPSVSSNGDARKRATSAPPATSRGADVSAKSAGVLVAPSAPAFRVTLATPSDAERATLKRSATKRMAGHARPPKAQPLAIGFPRDVPAAQREIALGSLAWQTLPDGSRAG
jgi:hypothetical protein